MMAGGGNDIAKPRYKQLGTRAISGLVMVAICLVPIIIGGWVFALFIGLLGLRVIWEWVRMTEDQPVFLSAFILGLTFLAALYFMVCGDEHSAFYAIAIGAAIAIAERLRRGGALWAGIGAYYVIFCAMCLFWIRNFGDNYTGLAMLIYVAGLVNAADTFAYLGGSTFKGPKMAPKISPNKTWSGFFSGLLGACIIGGIIAHIAGPGFVRGALLAAPLSVLAVVGDFFESYVKRRRNVKDSGGILPGHGGLLDRLDSHLFAGAGFAVWLWNMPAIWPIAS